MVDPRLQLLFESALARATALYAEVRRLRAKQFAFPLPNKLLETFERFAQEARAAIGELENDPVFKDPRVTQHERLESLRTRAADIEWLHNVLEVVDKVDSSRLPFEIVRCFQSLAKEVLGSTAEGGLMLYPGRTFNYAIMRLETLFQARGRSEAAAQFLDDLLLLLPSAEPSSILMHTLFFHELGHPLYHRKVQAELDEVFRNASVEAQIALKTQIEREVSTRLSLSGFTLGDDRGDQPTFAERRAAEEQSLLVDEAMELAGAWAEEIFCDLCGLRLVGPAFLCAFESFFLPFSIPTECSSSHPAPWHRLELLNRYLQRLRGEDKAFDAVCKQFDSCLGVMGDEKSATSSDLGIVERIASHMLRPEEGSILVQALEDSISRLITAPFSERFVQALTQGVEQLQALIPPDPLLHFPRSHVLTVRENIAYVFNVIWMFRAKSFVEWEKRFHWHHDRSEEALNQIAMKALDAVELERRWQLGQSL